LQLPDAGLGERIKPHPFGYRVAREEASTDAAAFGLRLPSLCRLAGIRPMGANPLFGANPHFKLVRFGYNRCNKQ
jgi:hypothetical protein